MRAKIRDPSGRPLATLSAGSEKATRRDVLEWARLYIDRMMYADGLPGSDARMFHDMEIEIGGALARVAGSGEPVTRDRVARELEVAARASQEEWEVQAHKYFTSHPLRDRLKWIDTAVKQYRLSAGLPTGNPKRARGGSKKKPAKKDRRKLLRKLLRGT